MDVKRMYHEGRQKIMAPNNAVKKRVMTGRENGGMAVAIPPFALRGG